MASIERLRDGCKSGDYYEALQFFKSVVSRKINSRKSMEDAFALILEGTNVSWEYSEKCSGAALEIASQVIPLFETYAITVDNPVVVEKVSALAAVMKLSPAAKPTDLPVTHKKDFLQKVMQWFSSARQNLPGDVKPVDSAPLHLVLAETLVAAGESKKAYTHFLHGSPMSMSSGVPSSFCTHVVGICKENARNGSTENAAFWAARATLHLLVTLGKGTDAKLNAVRRALAFLDALRSAQEADGFVIMTAPIVVFADTLCRLIEFTHSQAKDAEIAATRKAVDSLIDAFSVTLKSADPKMRDLAVAVVQAHEATIAHVKEPSIFSSVLSMLGSGGATPVSPATA